MQVKNIEIFVVKPMSSFFSFETPNAHLGNYRLKKINITEDGVTFSFDIKKVEKLVEQLSATNENPYFSRISKDITAPKERISGIVESFENSMGIDKKINIFDLVGNEGACALYLNEESTHSDFDKMIPNIEKIRQSNEVIDALLIYPLAEMNL